MHRKAQILPERVSRDVATVRREALTVITIKPDDEIEVRENLRGRLNVVAVIGPTVDLDGNKYAEALLAEVALSSGLPYKRGQRKMVWGSRRELLGGKPQSIARRWDYFTLNANQYHFVSWHLFTAIQDLVDRRIATWGTHGPWRLRMNLSTVNARYRGNSTHFSRSVEIPRGIQVVFPKKDGLFDSDLYWAELSSPSTQCRVLDFASRVTDRISPYRRGFRRKDFRTLTGFRSLERLLQRTKLPTHLRIEALKYVPEDLRSILQHELEAIFHPAGYSNESSDGKAFPQIVDPSKRLPRLDIQITKDADDFIVCQFYPNDPWRFRDKPSDPDDDLPF